MPAGLVGGALLFLLAWSEGSNWFRKRGAAKALTAARNRLAGLDHKVGEARATLAARSRAIANLDQVSRVAADRRKAQLQALVAQEEHSKLSRSTTPLVIRGWFERIVCGREVDPDRWTARQPF